MAFLKSENTCAILLHFGCDRGTTENTGIQAGGKIHNVSFFVVFVLGEKDGSQH